MFKNIQILILTIVLIFTSELSFSQISPGDLVSAHAHLEGISNCTKCHTLGDKVSNTKCLDCHKEIKERIDQKRGYHISIDVVGKDCFICHNDHHGRNFQIIRFDTTIFNHDLAGYKLEGAHRNQNCKDCHQPENISNQELQKKSITYLGLEINCLSCHDDYHQNTLSTNCIDCHGIDNFKPALKFDHNNTSYKLLGKHEDVDCLECHKIEEKNGKNFQEFAGIKSNNCTDCHTDIHNDQFGQDCKQCHTEQSFTEIKGIDNFDHNKTRYVLEGKHQSVDCKSCHKKKYTDPLAFSRCMDCHDDFHEDQFVSNNKKSDCKDCHSVKGFIGSSYTIEKHSNNNFPLKGAHIATPCFVCHQKENKWKFKDIGTNCIDCHDDIHSGLIDQEFYPESNCKSCHVESIWSRIDFDHKNTDFELIGVHEEQTCRSCHFPVQENGDIVQKFSDLNSDCTNCHKDIHYNQFDADGITKCVDCHQFEDWKPDKFDHNNTRFIIDGQHDKLACIDCHKPKSIQQNTYIEYKLNLFKCEDCHQ